MKQTIKTSRVAGQLEKMFRLLNNHFYGGEFGLGCEMVISTQKLHARGPMGLAELCTYKYIIHGSGQTRGGAAAKLQTPCC